MRQVSTKSRNFQKEWQRFLRRTSASSSQVERAVAKIIAGVRKKGDTALFAYTRRFDRFRVSTRNIRVSPQAIRQARQKIPSADYQALKRAVQRIRRFHGQQRLKDWSLNAGGARMGLRWLPIERVGLYVPGGQAAYPSTVLMNAIPARVAGVADIVMVTPTPEGFVNPYTLAAAELVGVREIYRVGGAQAIAALAYGTRSIPAVDKIVGPGNVYVATAKRQVFGQVAIDMIAGPTELLILADARANPNYIAADLLSQAEHDADARVVLISTSRTVIDKALLCVKGLLKETARRRIAAKSLRQNGLAILARNRTEAVQLANEMAPEHLELMVRDRKRWLAQIQNAAAIFLGDLTPVAAGDYTAGPNHVLPTARTARFASPLGVYDFMKASSWLELSKKGLDRLSDDIVRLSELEGLTAHGKSVTIRK